ncbi:glycerophosphodiester phosphodiesterase [Bacillus sp. B15-48]|uniref:glycerophosphodiester phosphodiesterase n=1 Tax=Bacillus sp. B15-48 TaxID=1548601 RepID=UPI00193FB804|nr:glycerophosphodiester phosphodiesterase [Bacillus sp. B15-48]MBM4760995.1 glycerophosphodiester phosphodiesterase [Bacillus sp. B15-48]
MTKTKIYGHRGSMGQFPENTLLGFREAIIAGVDGIELDVHMTKDKEIVVIHDEQLNRTTNGKGFIKDLYLSEIKEYSAGIKFSDYEDSWEMEKVPTLKEVFELLAPFDTELNIELKTSEISYGGIEEEVLSIVKQYGKGRKVVFSSFHLPSLMRIKQLDPTAEIAWLLFYPIGHPQDHLETFQFESLHLFKSIVLTDIDTWKPVAQSLRLWTVNETDELQQLLALEVDTIITDFPQRAIIIRDENKKLVF